MTKKRSHKIRKVLMLILLACILFVFWQMLSHGTPPGDAELRSRPHRLTVLTWNTARMGNFAKPAKNEVLRFLAQQDADVVCLQEVDVYKDAHFLTLQEVKQVLGAKYPYSYLDFAVYDKRHQFGTMIWSRYPLINKHTIHYQTRGNMSNCCDVVVETDTIRLFNNHLESYYFTPEDLADVDTLRNYQGLRESARRVEEKWKRATPLRNAQARTVHDEVKQSPYPAIVVGDFNAIPLSYTYMILSIGMHDAFAETSWFRWGATCEKRGIGMRIDYILCSDPILPVQCSIGQTKASDHRPVIATLAW